MFYPGQMMTTSKHRDVAATKQNTVNLKSLSPTKVCIDFLWFFAHGFETIRVGIHFLGRTTASSARVKSQFKVRWILEGLEKGKSEGIFCASLPYCRDRYHFSKQVFILEMALGVSSDTCPKSKKALPFHMVWKWGYLVAWDYQTFYLLKALLPLSSKRCK